MLALRAACAMTLLGLGRHAGRLVRHRDRPPALAGHRRPAPPTRPGGPTPAADDRARRSRLPRALRRRCSSAYVAVLFYMAAQAAARDHEPRPGRAGGAAAPPASRPDKERIMTSTCRQLAAASSSSALMGLAMLALRRPRRLRPRRRHAACRRGRRREGPHDRLDRPVLGRQRDLAGARRRPAAGRLPAGARHDPRRRSTCRWRAC